MSGSGREPLNRGEATAPGGAGAPTAIWALLGAQGSQRGRSPPIPASTSLAGQRCPLDSGLSFPLGDKRKWRTLGQARPRQGRGRRPLLPAPSLAQARGASGGGWYPAAPQGAGAAALFHPPDRGTAPPRPPSPGRLAGPGGPLGRAGPRAACQARRGPGWAHSGPWPPAAGVGVRLPGAAPAPVPASASAATPQPGAGRCRTSASGLAGAQRAALGPASRPGAPCSSQVTREPRELRATPPRPRGAPLPPRSLAAVPASLCPQALQPAWPLVVIYTHAVSQPVARSPACTPVQQMPAGPLRLGKPLAQV